METPTQFGHDLFHILLYRNDAAELLLQTTPGGVCLPTVPIPAHTRVAEQITRAIKSSWNFDTYCLFPLSRADASNSRIRYQVLEACPPEPDPPDRMHWIPVHSASAAVLEDPADFTASQESLRHLDQYRRSELPGAFGKPGWLRMITDWVQAHAAGLGLSLTGKFRQLNASPTFSLIRFETDGPALWFKAVGEPNLHEHRITLKLASLFPNSLSTILASRPEWNAWLALESVGSPLNTDSTAWATAVENLALLQLSSLGRRFDLIDSGCRDLRPCRLLDLVDPFLETMAGLMKQQTKIPPAPLSREELNSLGQQIISAIAEIQNSAIPDTLGQLDMNPDNVLVSDRRCVFLDWAEAYVGPPFFTFQYLLEHWRQLHKEDLRNEACLETCYAKHWTHFASPSEIATALCIAPLLAAFTYAAGSQSWRNPEEIQPTIAASLRSLTRRMKREADKWLQRRLTCVQ